jgi:hypothetical protein
LQARQAVLALIDLLDDPDREVQGAAVWALGQVGGRQAREALRTCLMSDDEVLREAAEEALSELEFYRDPLSLSLYGTDLGGEEEEDEGLFFDEEDLDEVE